MSTSTLTSPDAAAPTRASRGPILALALGGFGIGTTEFAAMGLLPSISSSLSISEPTAGHIISAYAIGVVVGAPLIAAATARMSRRSLLIALMVAFTVGNLLTVVAPNYETLMAARFIAGLPHGAYFGVAALVASHMAGPGKRAQAVGRVMLGLSVANVIGVPVATWLGQAVGWRAAFGVTVVIGLATLVALRKNLPPLSDMRVTSPLTELGALKRPQVWLTLFIGIVGFGGMFAFYSYIHTTLTDVSGLADAFVPIALALFGLGMVVGNIVGGAFADRSVIGAMLAGLVSIAVALAVFAIVAGNEWIALALVFVVGVTGSSMVPALQTRLMDVADDAQTLAAALNHSALNIANAAGAWLGGIVIAHGLGYRAPSVVGAVLAAAGLLVLAVAVVTSRRK